MMDTFTDIADPFMGVSEDTGTVLPTHTGLVQGSSSGSWSDKRWEDLDHVDIDIALGGGKRDGRVNQLREHILQTVVAEKAISRRLADGENIIIGWAEGSRNPFLTITHGAKRKAGNAAKLHALGVPSAKSGNLLLNDDNDVRPSPAFKALEQFLGEKQESNATSTETQNVTIWVSPLCTHCPNYIQMAGKPLCKPYRQALERRAIKSRRAQKRSPSPSPPPPPPCPIGHRAQQNSDSDTDTDAGSLAGNDQMDSGGTDTDREQPGDEDQHATQIKKERSAASKAAVEIENAELKCQQKTTIKQNADLRVHNADLVAQNAVLVAHIAELVQGKRKMEEEEEDRIERIVKARLSERMPSTRTSRQLKKEELKVRQQSLESLADADGDSSDDDSDDLPQPPNLKRSQSV